jgi:OPA family glycerol-3-phosphate transporter-like MFS transporter
MSALDYSPDFRRRRLFNWFPLGLAYAFLYMGRYSLIPAKNDLLSLMDNASLGVIVAVGSIAYGFSFLINGPLTDRIGGRRAMIIACFGSGVVNLLMGSVLAFKMTDDLTVTFSIMYAVNMYFQSFAAVSIVKVNSAWFHINERGVFGGIFGIMISSGLFLAYTVAPVVMKFFFPSNPEFYFIIPGTVLGFMGVMTILIIHDTPEAAGFPEFTTGTETEFDQEGQLPVGTILKKIISHPVVLTIAFIEFCTGVLRNGVMTWFPSWAKQSAMPGVMEWWGVGLFAAGVTGGLFAGFLSDKVFQSRRPPVAGLLYGAMFVVTAVVAVFLWLAGSKSLIAPIPMFFGGVLMSMCVIGTHGVLSGAASADFGGKQATATAVGLIDGFVYLGVGLQSICLGYLTKSNWNYWMPFLIPFTIIGFLLALRIWKVKPATSGGGH